MTPPKSENEIAEALRDGLRLIAAATIYAAYLRRKGFEGADDEDLADYAAGDLLALEKGLGENQ